MGSTIAANRMNAKRSTGPKTPAGKKRSSMNALKHGLSGKAIVIGDENPEEFEAFCESLKRDWRPETAYERELVCRAAALFWRLRRIPLIEAAIVDSRRQLAYDEVRSQVEKEKFDGIKREAYRRLNKFFDYDPIKYLIASGGGLWDDKFVEICQQVLDEEQSKEDISTWIAKEADQRYEKSRESELMLLMQSAEKGDLIDRLSRYETALMSSLNRTLQQLWLAQNMRHKSQMITVERARPD